jgi:hypothetical protein
MPNAEHLLIAVIPDPVMALPLESPPKLYPTEAPAPEPSFPTLGTPHVYAVKEESM